MNRLHDDDVIDDSSSADREISLGTPTILGIFFALALLCACFFGLGYTMGRKSVPSTTVADTTTPSLSATPKPTAASPANVPVIKAPDPMPGPSVTVPTSDAPAPPSNTRTVAPSDTVMVGEKPTVAPPAPQPATANLQPATVFMVQVAAVSSQDVADIELAALAKKGYNVAVHHEPQDKLLHIQIGPFTDRKQAEVMRQRVLADGFNAIVK